MDFKTFITDQEKILSNQELQKSHRMKYPFCYVAFFSPLYMGLSNLTIDFVFAKLNTNFTLQWNTLHLPKWSLPKLNSHLSFSMKQWWYGHSGRRSRKTGRRIVINIWLWTKAVVLYRSKFSSDLRNTDYSKK